MFYISRKIQSFAFFHFSCYNDCTINNNLQVRREIMNTEIRVAIDKFKEVKDILKKFDSKDEAIEYLVNETKLSKEECSTAYDIIIKIEN